MPDNRPHPGEQHPPEWRNDLNPNALAGQIIGPTDPQPGQGARTAHDAKNAHWRLGGLRDDELRQISILPFGSLLEQGATYLDLRDLDAGEFTATAEQEVDPGRWIVARKQADY